MRLIGCTLPISKSIVIDKTIKLLLSLQFVSQLQKYFVESGPLVFSSSNLSYFPINGI